MVHADDQYDPGLVPEMVRADPRRPRPTWSSARGCCATARSPAACRAGSGSATACSPAIENRAFGVAALRVPHRLPRLLGRPAALDPVPAQLRRLRLRPGDLRPGPRARRARGRGPDPDALLPRGVERRPARRASATACMTLGVLARFAVDRRRGRWPLLRRTGRRPRRPAPRSDARAPASALLAVALRGRGARAAHRLRQRHAGLRPAPRRGRLRRPRRARSPQGEGFSKTLAHGRPTAFRPPGYPYFLGAVYHVFKADRKPVKERVHVARIAQAFVGAALVALVGVIAAQLWGSIAALVALGLARDLPAADPRRRRGDVRAAVRRLHARLARGGAGLPALEPSLRVGAAGRASSAAWPR